jgi:hypothetical protein
MSLSQIRMPGLSCRTSIPGVANVHLDLGEKFQVLLVIGQAKYRVL